MLEEKEYQRKNIFLTYASLYIFPHDHYYREPVGQERSLNIIQPICSEAANATPARTQCDRALKNG